LAVIGYFYTGAGYQYVGMGRKVFDAYWSMRQFYDKAEKFFPDFKINKLAFMGPEEELLKEANGLIINFCYQCGLNEVLKQQKVNPEQAAGYKSGEIAALCMHGFMEFDEALKLMRLREELVKNEIKTEYSQMLINSVKIENIKKIAAELSSALKTEITSYNSDESAVLAFDSRAKEKITALFRQVGGTVIDLPGEELTGIAALQPVANRLKEQLKGIKNDKPIIRVIDQTTGAYYESTSEIREKFFDFLYKPSMTGEAAATMIKNGVNTFVEMGAGTFISRLIKKADSGKRMLNTHDLNGLSVTIKLAN